MHVTNNNVSYRYESNSVFPVNFGLKVYNFVKTLNDDTVQSPLIAG